MRRDEKPSSREKDERLEKVRRMFEKAHPTGFTNETEEKTNNRIDRVRLRKAKAEKPVEAKPASRLGDAVLAVVLGLIFGVAIALKFLIR